MTGSIKLIELPAGSIRIATHRRKVRIDEETEETEQCYLTVEGSPDGFRWLSQHCNSLAVSASKGGSAANIVAAWDFKNNPIELDEWDSIDFSCRKSNC